MVLRLKWVLALKVNEKACSQAGIEPKKVAATIFYLIIFTTKQV